MEKIITKTNEFGIIKEEIEQKLKSINGKDIWKYTTKINGKIKEVVYAVYDEDNDIENCFKTLKEVQDWLN